MSKNAKNVPKKFKNVPKPPKHLKTFENFQILFPLPPSHKTSAAAVRRRCGCCGRCGESDDVIARELATATQAAAARSIRTTPALADIEK